LTRDPWTVEAGLITPTMELRREPLARRFEREIEALYSHPDRATRAHAQS
jgi:long-chain acyl-CoA synthetase